jgi:hypothetical protein
MAHDPSDCIHDTFREKNFGAVSAPSNSRSATSNFYVDRSRLRSRSREEYVPSPSPNKSGKFVTRAEQCSIMDNARRAAGEMGSYSSFANEGARTHDFDWHYTQNPITKRRGDD